MVLGDKKKDTKKCKGNPGIPLRYRHVTAAIIEIISCRLLAARIKNRFDQAMQQ